MHSLLLMSNRLSCLQTFEEALLFSKEDIVNLFSTDVGASKNIYDTRLKTNKILKDIIPSYIKLVDCDPGINSFRPVRYQCSSKSIVLLYYSYILLYSS